MSVGGADGVKPVFLVTGAGGFIGRHLCAVLRDRHYQVITVGRKPAEGMDGQLCELSNPEAVAELLKKNRPTGIFHCAGTFSDDWNTDFQANVLLPQILLESVQTSGVGSRVLLLGSAAEYGTASGGAVSEEAPLQPCSIYGVTKAMQTALMTYYHRRFGLNGVMARTVNLFGEGCSPALFPGRVLQQACEVRQGSRPKIEVRSLDSRRDYMPVSAAALSYLRIMLYGVSGEIYNVGSGVPMPLSELLLELISPHGLTMDDVQIDVRASGTRTSVPVIYADLAKLLRLPEVPLSGDWHEAGRVIPPA